jgi:transcriptional regulator with XRE-family HTH domain
MAIDANDILARLPEDERAAIEARAQELIAEEVGLAELRKLLDQTQAELAGRMEVGQAHISKIERRKDILLSTLREYVEAAGGSLEIVVRVPDRPALRLNFGSKGRPRQGRTDHGYSHGHIVQRSGRPRRRRHA